MEVELVKGDITTFKVDVIVNAANSSLMGGGGVDGAIHEAAGPELLDECKLIRKNFSDGLRTGEAVITKGYELPAKFVIHTVGPIYGKDDVNLLRNCYLNSLKLAEKNNCKSIAFPAISTGVYGVPLEVNARIVRVVMRDYHGKIEKVYLVLHSDADLENYKRYFL